MTQLPAASVYAPQRRSARSGLAAFMLAVGIATLTPDCTRPMDPSAAAPIVRTSLHQHLRVIQERSEFRLQLDGVLDDSPAIIDQPVRLQYGSDGDPLGFTLPAGNFVLLQQYAGFVYGIRASPQLGAAPLPDALRALREAERVIDASGWRKAAGALGDDAVRTYAGGPNPPRDLPVVRWTGTGQKLTLSLKRTLESDAARPLFFASVAIEDVGDAHFESYRAALHAKRRQFGAAPGESLPVLRYWSDTVAPAPGRPHP